MKRKTILLVSIIILIALPITALAANDLLGDVSGDGKVNSVDAALILQYDAGLISEFPAESTATETQPPAATTLPSPTFTPNGDVFLERSVVYEGNDVSITATSIEKDLDAYSVSFLIENNSSLNLGFNAHAYAVNGVMTHNNIYDMDCDVAAGKKAVAKLTIKDSVLNNYDITDIRCVDILFWAYDNDKSYKEFETTQVEIKTNLYDGTHDLHANEEIYIDDSISVDYLFRDGNDFYFNIINRMNNYFNYDFNEITINDFTVTARDYDLYNEVILENCSSICKVSVTDKFLKEIGIDKIESVQWNMSIRPGESHHNEYKIGPIVLLLDTDTTSPSEDGTPSITETLQEVMPADQAEG